MSREDLLNESDMLKGNINRMMVTHDLNELLTMYSFTTSRVEKIFKERWKILLDEKINNEKIIITQKYDETDSLATKDFIERNEVNNNECSDTDRI